MRSRDQQSSRAQKWYFSRILKPGEIQQFPSSQKFHPGVTPVRRLRQSPFSLVIDKTMSIATLVTFLFRLGSMMCMERVSRARRCRETPRFVDRARNFPEYLRLSVIVPPLDERWDKRPLMRREDESAWALRQARIKSWIESFLLVLFLHEYSSLLGLASLLHHTFLSRAREPDWNGETTRLPRGRKRKRPAGAPNSVSFASGSRRRPMRGVVPEGL